jgi:hypothetical protein
MGEHWTMRPEDIRKSVNSRLRLQKERSANSLQAKHDLHAMARDFGAVGIVEWVRYIFRRRVWSL